MSGIARLETRVLCGIRRHVATRLRLRVNARFPNRHIIVREGMGERDRAAILLPPSFSCSRLVLRRSRSTFNILDTRSRRNLAPFALARKMPHAAVEFSWRCVFRGATRSVDLVSKRTRCHQKDVVVVQKTVHQFHSWTHATPLIAITNNSSTGDCLSWMRYNYRMDFQFGLGDWQVDRPLGLR